MTFYTIYNIEMYPLKLLGWLFCVKTEVILLYVSR